MFATWLDPIIEFVRMAAPDGSYLSQSFNIRALLAVILVSLICGAVGSLVVGNRMAFFSDALAHCAIAGAALGLLLGIATNSLKGSSFVELGIPLIMVGFGVAVGFGIAYVRQKTDLSSDTVIGVFFAGAIGFGAVMSKMLSRYTFYTPEMFFFGNPLAVGETDLLILFGLAVATALFLLFLFNPLVFSTFNPSLAKSRNISIRLCEYIFILLLALVVNLSIKAVGVLLINGLLIVPAATASNLSRNMRQMFWGTLFLSLTAGVLGQWLTFELEVELGNLFHTTVALGSSGMIVVFCVIMFFLSLALTAWWPRTKAAEPAKVS